MFEFSFQTWVFFWVIIACFGCNLILYFLSNWIGSKDVLIKNAKKVSAKEQELLVIGSFGSRKVYSFDGLKHPLSFQFRKWSFLFGYISFCLLLIFIFFHITGGDLSFLTFSHRSLAVLLIPVIILCFWLWTIVVYFLRDYRLEMEFYKRNLHINTQKAKHNNNQSKA